MNDPYQISTFVAGLTLALVSTTTVAVEASAIATKPSQLAPNQSYHVVYQNPGAPDQLLLDAPDSTNQRFAVDVNVINNSIVLQNTDTTSRQGRTPTDAQLNSTKSPVNQLPLDIYTAGGTVRSTQCVLDFTDAGALQLSEPSLWFDRIYLPWFQNCNGTGFIDLRPLLYGHFHVAFEDPDVVPCASNAQAYPSRLGEDGTCDFVDVPTEPRTHMITHEPSEYMWLRFYGNNAQWQTFALNQNSVLGNRSVRICYRKDQEVDLDWITSGQQQGTVPGVWLCWNNVTPGNWDLSNWAFDITDVKITGATEGSGPFSLDNFYVQAQ